MFEKIESVPPIPSSAPLRAEAWLRERIPGLSRRHAREAIERGLITRPEGGKLKKGDKIRPGEELETSPLSTHLQALAEGSDIEVTVVQEHPDFVVIDKPAGLPSHPVGLFDTRTVSHWALKRYPQARAEFPEIQPTLAVHRLDTGTSGLLVVALTRRAFDEWRERFQEKKITKTYHAWCWGEPNETEFTINVPLGHDPKDRRKMAAAWTPESAAPPVLPALTSVQIILSHEGRFLAKVTATTGVTHQVRAHLASLGFPLVGDWLYDAEHASRPFQTRLHQLRAVGLATDGFSCELEAQAITQAIK